MIRKHPGEDLNTLASAANMASTGSRRFSKPAPFLSPKEPHLMSKHVTISPAEAAHRLAIRELVEAYAHRADRRDAKGQMALFTEDTHFVVYMNAKDPKPSQELHSRVALAPVFDDLNKYAATQHFVVQSTSSTSTGWKIAHFHKRVPHSPAGIQGAPTYYFSGAPS